MDQRFNPAAHRLMLSMGHVLTVMYIVGWFPLAQFFPIPAPSMPAEELAQWLAGHKDAYMMGCMLMLIAGGLMAPWGAALAVWTRITEDRFPVLYIAQITSLAAATGLFVIIAIFWGLAGYRATEIDPEITQMVYDAGWFLFLWIGPTFYIWAVCFGLGIIMNPPTYQWFPRWVGWFCIVSVLCWAMGLFHAFFQIGPMAYDGLFPTWIPLVIFFLWVEVLTFYGNRAIRLQEQVCLRETGAGMGVYKPDWGDPIEPSAYELAMRSSGEPAGRPADDAA